MNRKQTTLIGIASLAALSSGGGILTLAVEGLSNNDADVHLLTMPIVDYIAEKRI